jgi:hypothetical protein
MTRPCASLRRSSLPILLAALAVQGCFWPGMSMPGGAGSGSSAGGYEAAMQKAQTSADDQQATTLENARSRAKKNPGSVDDARLFAQAVTGAFELGMIERKQLDGAALVAEASDALEAAAVAFPDQKAELMFSKGGMLLAAKKTDDGITALRASMDAKPSPRACVALIAELDKKGDPKKEIVPLCKKARPGVADDETRYALLDACLQRSHASSAAEGLKWAGNADITFYKEYSMKIQVENDERRRQEEARSAEARAEMDARRAEEDRRRASSSSQSSAPSAPSGWSVSLHNECKQTVKLFLGKKPKWGSGTYTSIGSNTISSYSGSAGDMIWIVDDGQNGLSSLTPSGNQRIKILPGCSGFAPE